MANDVTEGRAFRALVGTGMFVIVVAGMKAAQSILVPVLMAGFLAIICWPPLKWLQDHKVPTAAALMIIVLVIAIVGALVGGLIGTSVNDFIGKLPDYEKRLRAERDAAVAWVEDKGFKVPKYIKGPSEDDSATDPATDETIDEDGVSETESSEEGDPETGASEAGDSDQEASTDVAAPTADDPPTEDIAKGLEEAVGLVPKGAPERPSAAKTPPIPKIDDDPMFDLGHAVQMFGSLVGTLNNYLTNALMILLILVFMLLETAGLSAKASAIMGGKSDDEDHTNTIADRVRSYVALKTIISLLTGVLIVLLLKILGVDYAEMWGVLAFFFNFVPNIGSFIAAIPAVLFALLTAGWGTALWAAAGFLAVNGVVGNIVEPRILGRGLGLSTLVVFLSLLFWGWVFGPIGMLLSVPLTMIAKIVAENSEETRWLAILLSSDASLSESTEK